MASVYPTNLDSFATNKVNSSDAGDETQPAVAGDHAAHHNNLADAVNKMEAELGINPSGAASTVKDRFDTLEAGGPLGSANNPVTDAAAVRPSLTRVWWATATTPANGLSGDFWIDTVP